MIDKMYYTAEQPKKVIQKESLKVRGRSKNNIVLEVENKEVINLPSHELVTTLETELKKIKMKLKNLDGVVNRIMIENTKMRNELNSLKQLLGRNY